MLFLLKRPGDHLESKDDKESSSKKHHGASITAESADPNSTGSHTNGENPKEIVLSGNLHPKLVEALSQVPYSPLFGILWPLIVENASFETRNQLREVSHYFEALCRPHTLSDDAKSVRHIPHYCSL
jgi:hypothetical protein